MIATELNLGKLRSELMDSVCILAVLKQWKKLLWHIDLLHESITVNLQ